MGLSSAEEAEEAEAVETLAIETIERLRGLPRQDLINLPKVDERVINEVGRKSKVTTYHEELGDGLHLIAVQVIRERWFGLSATVCARGFVLTASDERVDADESLLWQFR